MKLFEAHSWAPSDRVCVYKSRVRTELGKEVFASSKLSFNSFRLLKRSLTQFRSEARDQGLPHITAYATSAFRSARNGRTFAERLSQETGVTIKIISGAEEAALLLNAGANHFEDDFGLIDIGGGSTEIILPSLLGTKKAESFLVGAARTAGYDSTGLDSAERDLQRFSLSLLSHVNEQLLRPPKKFVASSGSLAALRRYINLERTSDTQTKKESSQLAFSRNFLLDTLRDLERYSERRIKQSVPKKDLWRLTHLLPTAKILHTAMEVIQVKEVHFKKLSLIDGLCSKELAPAQFRHSAQYSKAGIYFTEGASRDRKRVS